MAETSRDTLDLLMRGASAIGEMQALGLSPDEVGAILGQSAERVGRYDRRPGTGRGKPLKKETEVVIENGRAVIKPKGDNTSLRSVEERTSPQARPGQSLPNLSRPDVTERYVNVVKAGLGKADQALQGERTIEREGQEPIQAKLYADDFGQRVIPKPKSDVYDKETRSLADVGVVDLTQEEPDRRSEERYDGPSEAALAARERQQEDFDEKVAILRRSQPRDFENVAGLRYGDTPGEFMPDSASPTRRLEQTILQLEQAAAAGQIDLDAPISTASQPSRRPLQQYKSLYRDEESNLRPNAKAPKGFRTQRATPTESTITVRQLLNSLKAATPQGELANQKAAARQEVQRNPVSQERAARNQSDLMAAVESERGRRRRGIFPAGNPAEEALRQRLGVVRDDEQAIRNLQGVSDLFEGDVAATAEENLLAGRVTDRGTPFEQTTAIAGSNTPSTHQALNAPTSESAIDWVAKQVNAEGSASMFEGRRIPDIDMSTQLQGLQDRISGLVDREVKVRDARGIGRKVRPFDQALIDEIGPVRSVDALQKASDAILRVGGEAGIQFPRMVMQEGRMVRDTATPSGVGEVLDFLKMNAGEQQRLGITLNNLDLADKNTLKADTRSKSVVNKQQKEAFKQGIKTSRPDVVFGVKDLTGSGLQPEADIEMAPEKQARAFRQSSDPEAAMGFIGAVKDEVAPVRKAPGIMSPIDIEKSIRGKAEARGYEVKEENIENAKIVAERARRAEEDQANKRFVLEDLTSQSMFPAMRRRY